MIRFAALLSCVVLVLGGIPRHPCSSIRDRDLPGDKNPLDEWVVGGDAVDGQFPYMVSIRNKTHGNTHCCGGSILNIRHILTAAHCGYKQSHNQFFVVVGATHLSFGGQAHELETAVYHSGYNPQSKANDIAILKTASDIIFNDRVQPIPLQITEVPDGAPMIASGWGYTTWPGTGHPENLRWTYLIHLNNKQCAERMRPKYKIFPTQSCTYTRPGHGACEGDSGGPLVYAGHVAGVVSYCEPRAIGYPDVFIRVESYVPWITGIVSNNK